MKQDYYTTLYDKKGNPLGKIWIDASTVKQIQYDAVKEKFDDIHRMFGYHLELKPERTEEVDDNAVLRATMDQVLKGIEDDK